MSSPNIAQILSAIGAGLGGWNRGKFEAQDLQDRKDDAQFRQQQRLRMGEQWNREEQVRNAMAGAAQPDASQADTSPSSDVQVTPGPQASYTADDGSTLNEPALPPTYSVNGQNFGNDYAAAQAATPRPMMGPPGAAAASPAASPAFPRPRMGGVASAPAASGAPRPLMGGGSQLAYRQADAVQALDPVLAAQLRSSANEQQAQELKLSQGLKDAADQDFDRHLQQVGTFDGLAQTISDSNADGQGGALKVRAVPTPDGKKITFQQVNPDGSTTATAYTYDNTPDGLTRAKFDLSRMTTPEQKITHLHQVFQEGMQQKQLDQERQLKQQELTAQNQRSAAERQTQLQVAGLLGADGKPIGDDQIESMAQQYANGTLPAPSGRGGRIDPMTRRILARAAEINPSYGTAHKVLQDFTSGKSAASVKSFNVALSHLDTLDRLTGALGNGNNQLINKIWQGADEKMGSTAPSNFDAAKSLVADEIVKAVSGSSGALGDRQSAEDKLSRAKSPDQLKQVIGTYKEMMRGQLEGLRHQYEQGTGLDNFDRLLTDKGKVQASSSGVSKAPPAATNLKGWTLHQDKSGNLAYVSPDGKSFEEVK